MKNLDLPDLGRYFKDWAPELEMLRQNQLLNESAFLSFSKKRGIAVFGVCRGDPGNFNKRGWLTCDGLCQDETPLFHPFRIYPLYLILEICELNIAASSSLHRENMPKLVDLVMESKPSDEKIECYARGWNRIVDLSILLEPLYWPTVTGCRTFSSFISEKDYDSRLAKYRERVIPLIKSINVDEGQKIHETLRIKAANLDENGALYLFLRLSKWNRREKLTGVISGALWFRHIAEIIRRAFEEVHAVKWHEEDQSFGHWFPNARTTVYGSERPLDDVVQSRPQLAFHYGLFTGSVVRWYVEGDTEYHSILSVIEKPERAGIELINLKGNIASERDNIALKLSDAFATDRAHRRFSMVSFDLDVTENVKFIGSQMDKGNIVGFIAAHKPDFEFANFALEELIEIAACLDEANGTSGDTIRNGEWINITCSKDFEKRYINLSERKPRSLKGAEWGQSMAKYAADYPHRSDDHSERPFWREIRAALQGRISNYDIQKQSFRFDPETFELIKKV